MIHIVNPNIDTDVEATVTLQNGTHVLTCVRDLIGSLKLAGHVIEMQNGEVVVTPNVDADCLYILQSNRHDTQLIIEDSPFAAEPRQRSPRACRPEVPGVTAHAGVACVRQ